MKALERYCQRKTAGFLLVGQIAVLSGCSASSSGSTHQYGELAGTGGTSATGGATGVTSRSDADHSAGGTEGRGGTSASNSKESGGSSAIASDGNGGNGDSGTINESTGGSGTGGNSTETTGGAGAGSSSNGGASAITGGSTNGSTSANGTGGASASGGVNSSGDCTFSVSSRLASELDSRSPTTVGIVTWSVAGTTPTSANIEFGLDTSYGMAAPVDLDATDHQTPLLGMKPAKTYHYRIVASGSSGTCTSQDYTITTGAQTTSVSISSFSVKDETSRKRGFIVTSYWQGSGKAVPFILDADGEIVWWYGGGPSSGVARAQMSADGKNMWLVVPSLKNGGPVQRVSMDTLETQTYSSTKASHDIAAVTGATMAYIDYSTTCNGIIEIDPSGTTKKVFNAQGVVPSTGCHGNALRYSASVDAYSYSDLQSDVYIINRMGVLQWKLSDRVNGGNQSWGGKQHGHQLLDSSIIIFANGGDSSSLESRTIEYSLTGNLSKMFKSGAYTANFGDAQRLPGGNTLINYGNAHLIQEVDANDNVVLEIGGGSSSFGYSEWRDSLYVAPMGVAK